MRNYEPSNWERRSAVLRAPDRNGGTLRTVREAREYMLALADGRSMRQQWQHTALRILERSDVATVSRQVELALFGRFFWSAGTTAPPWSPLRISEARTRLRGIRSERAATLDPGFALRRAVGG